MIAVSPNVLFALTLAFAASSASTVPTWLARAASTSTGSPLGPTVLGSTPFPSSSRTSATRSLSTAKMKSS